MTLPALCDLIEHFQPGEFEQATHLTFFYERENRGPILRPKVGIESETRKYAHHHVPPVLCDKEARDYLMQEGNKFVRCMKWHRKSFNPELFFEVRDTNWFKP